MSSSKPRVNICRAAKKILSPLRHVRTWLLTFLSMNLTIFYFFYNLGQHSVFVNKAAFIIAQYSNPYGFILAALILFGIFFTHKDWKGKRYIEWLQESAIIGASVLVAYVVTVVLKYWAHAPRPFVALANVHPLIVETSYDSFPSGHATAFFALATAIYIYDKRWGTVFFLIAILVALSRVISGVHFPVDILVGAIIGVLVSLATYKILTKFFRSVIKK